MRNKFTSIFLSLVLVFTMMPSMVFAGSADESIGGDGSGACTSIYFGKSTTDNGSTLYGRTEDYRADWRKLMKVKPSVVYKNGEMYKSNNPGSTFTWPYPTKTLRYTYCHDSRFNEGVPEGYEPYGEIGVNEKNVAVTATVTLTQNHLAIRTSDPINSNGLDETDTTDLVLMQATTAREGVELLAEIVDQKGAAGVEGTMISDPNETWYFQTLSGSQYVGYKCPDNKVGLSPNITGNVGPDNYVDITNTEDFVVSDDLINIPVAANTFVGKDGDDATNPKYIKVADSYAFSTSNHTTGRLRMGYGFLHGFTKNSEIVDYIGSPASIYLNYFTDPKAGKKYSLYDAMQMLAYRGEGTEWESGNPTSNSASISNDRTQEAHVVEVRDNVPDEISTVKWLAMGPAEFNVYLPFYDSLVTEYYEKYNFLDQKDYNDADIEQNTFWHLAKKLYNLSKGPETAINKASREKYGDGVREFWARYQKSLIEQQPEVDAYLANILQNEGRLEAEREATRISKQLSKQTYNYYKLMIEELTEFTNNNTKGHFVPSCLTDKNALPIYEGLIPNNKFTIKTNATKGGKISEGGTYKKGSDITFTYQPDEGYAVNSVYVDGDKIKSDPKGGSYVIQNISADHNIFVYFEEDNSVLGEKATPKKAAPKNFKAKAQKGKVKLTWKKTKNITKYQVAYKAKDKKNWIYKTVSSKKATTTIKKLKKNKDYKFKIRSYKTTNNKKVYSKWSKTKTVKVK